MAKRAILRNLQGWSRTDGLMADSYVKIPAGSESGSNSPKCNCN